MLESALIVWRPCWCECTPIARIAHRSIPCPLVNVLADRQHQWQRREYFIAVWPPGCLTRARKMGTRQASLLFHQLVCEHLRAEKITPCQANARIR